jgi:hypothetical protein
VSAPRIVLYVGPNCGLCDEARALLSEAGIAFQEAEDPLFVLRVPVVEVAGSVASEGRINLLAVRLAMRRARSL